MITVVIKGNLTEAKDAADDRGIVLHTRRVVHEGEVLATCSDHYIEALARWFCEDALYPESESAAIIEAGVKPDVPCPPEGMPTGSLLFYA